MSRFKRNLDDCGDFNQHDGHEYKHSTSYCVHLAPEFVMKCRRRILFLCTYDGKIGAKQREMGEGLFCLNAFNNKRRKFSNQSDKICNEEHWRLVAGINQPTNWKQNEYEKGFAME